MTTQAVPDIVTVPSAQVVTRPDLFQPRDVPPGQDHDPEKVRQLVAHWNPDEYDPIAVARDPSAPDRYIVIAGHHRLAALRQLKAPEFAVKVIEGDAADPSERERLITQAHLSNYGVASPGVAERVATVRRLQRMGWTDERIADRMRLRRSQLEDLGYLTRLPVDVMYSVGQHAQMVPIAAEIGRAVDKYAMSEETASQLYKKMLAEFEATRKAPSRYALREKLADTHRKALTRSAQPGRLEGFGEDALLAQFAEDVAQESARRKDLEDTRRNLTKCEALASELGVSIEEVKRAARVRIDELTPEQESLARETLQERTPPPMRPPETAPAPTPVGVEAQGALGDDFATRRTLAMPMPGDLSAETQPVSAAPVRPDPRQARLKVRYVGPAAPAPPPPTSLRPDVQRARETAVAPRKKAKKRRSNVIEVSPAQISYRKARKSCP